MGRTEPYTLTWYLYYGSCSARPRGAVAPPVRAVVAATVRAFRALMFTRRLRGASASANQ